MTESGRHGRMEHGGSSGPGRRGLLVGVGALGVAAVGGGAYAVARLSGAVGGSGSSDAGGGFFGSTGPSPTPEPDPSILESLTDVSASVPGTTTVDLSTLSEPVAAAFPRVDGARGLSEAIDMAVNKILREHAWAGAAAGTLGVTGSLFASSADTLGAVLHHKDAHGTVPVVLYYRAADDRPFTSPGLVAAEQWAGLEKAAATAAATVEGLDAQAVAAALQEQPRPWGNGPAIIPDADGALHLVFPALTVDGAAAPVELEIDAATAAPLLSEDGTAVVAAVKTPAAFDPATVTIPGDGSTKGDALYVEPEVLPAQSPRTATGPGPVSQLAPLSGAGVRPSPVAAPDASRLRTMSLTFDDGPSAELNQQLRDALNEHHAAATFYMIGQNVHAFAQWCTRTATNGFEIGEHSWSHKQLSRLSGQALADQVGKPSDAIAEAIGRRPYVMRPPYGARNDTVDAAVGELGQSSQIWDVDTLDWQTKSVAKNIAAVQNGTRRGSIVLMHEIHPTSVEAVPQILDWLDEGGWTLLTASEIGQNQMRAGKHYMTGLVTSEGSDPAPASGASDGGH
ncbi:polysaccharide deacetylase family protein [Brachybacterium huguangmaarense]